MTALFKKDLYRYYGDRKETLREKMSRPPELKWLCAFRAAQSDKGLSRFFARMRLKKLTRMTHIQIPRNTEVGEGLYIGHCGCIIVNPAAKLGRNVNIAAGVTIGQENRGSRKGAPTIGNQVWIGSNAVIVGNITVGDDVLIAPLAYVNFDVPSHSIVIGNPARIIPREHATEGYVNRTV